MPKLPDLSQEAVLRRQVLTENLRLAREQEPPPLPPVRKIRIAKPVIGLGHHRRPKPN